MSREVSNNPADVDSSASSDVTGKPTSAPRPAPPLTSDAAYRANPGSIANNQQQPPHPPPPTSHQHLYHPYPPPPHSYANGGPYTAVVGNPASQYHPHHQPLAPIPQPAPTQGQSTNSPNAHMSSPRHSYDRDEHNYHRPVPVRGHPSESEYRGHPPPPPPLPPAGSYSASHYGPPPPDDRRWMPPPEAVPNHPPHHYPGYDTQRYSKAAHPSQPFPPPPPPVGPGHGHMPYRYTHTVYPATTSNRMEEKPRLHSQQPPPPPPQQQQTNSTEASYSNDVDDREGATSPSQIEISHRDEVTNMGCTCKKTKCLKLYCQCFAVKIHCGANCRCLVCYNTTKHEKQRKDAMRIILSRNPTAFDTKFSKSKERKTQEQQAVLAHKLGCKCRKSACMKKYCECYAGNVKCSPNCRCIGCKNVPTSGYGPGKPGDSSLAVRESNVGGYDMISSHSGRTGREPWMMNAAQNLAFLKHGSPTVEKRTATVHDAGDVASMPSLAASSSDTSPDDRIDESSAKIEVSHKDASNNGSVNSLLMAAMAMTEFQSKIPVAAETKRLQDEHTEAFERQEIPVTRKVFRSSPKRKSSDRAEPEIISGHSGEVEGEPYSREHQIQYRTAPVVEHHTQSPPFDGSPLDPREMKRTRLGSVRKKMTWENGRGGQDGSPEISTKENDIAPHETPDQKTSADKLTPVSARCIAFERMNVNEKKEATREES